MTKQHFTQLRSMLMRAPRLEPVMNYYQAHFAQAPDLMRESRKGSKEMLEMLEEVLVASARALGCSKVRNFRLLRMSGRPFFHGDFQVDGRPGSVFFFEDLSVGMAGLSLPSGELRYIRFSPEFCLPSFVI